MDRPLAAVIIFTSAVLLAHSAILVDSRRLDFRLLSSSSSRSSSSSPDLTPPPPPVHRRPHRGRGPLQSSRSRRRRRERRRDELGKKLGVLFAGIAVLLQFALGVFLGVKRWQISKMGGANTS